MPRKTIGNTHFSHTLIQKAQHDQWGKLYGDAGTQSQQEPNDAQRQHSGLPSFDNQYPDSTNDFHNVTGVLKMYFDSPHAFEHHMSSSPHEHITQRDHAARIEKAEKIAMKSANNEELTQNEKEFMELAFQSWFSS